MRLKHLCDDTRNQETETQQRADSETATPSPVQQLFDQSTETLKNIPFGIRFENENFTSNFLILPKLNKCEETRLLAVIISSPANFEIRRTIRTTWASKHQPDIQDGDVQTIFIVGSGNSLENLQLEKEANDFRDILLISFQDTYRNLVLKTLSLLYYHKHFCPAQFLLKVDDDVVFYFPRFMHFFSKLLLIDPSPAIYGKVWNHSRPERDPKHRWYISPESYAGDSLPPFCSGPSYVLNARAVNALLDGTKDISLVYNVEDVFVTGLLAERTGVKRIPMNRSIFPQNYSGVLSLLGVPCDADRIPYVFAVHGWKNSRHLYEIWARMKRLKCRRTRKVRKLSDMEVKGNREGEKRRKTISKDPQIEQIIKALPRI